MVQLIFMSIILAYRYVPTVHFHILSFFVIIFSPCGWSYDGNNRNLSTCVVCKIELLLILLVITYYVFNRHTTKSRNIYTHTRHKIIIILSCEKCGEPVACFIIIHTVKKVFSKSFDRKVANKKSEWELVIILHALADYQSDFIGKILVFKL